MCRAVRDPATVEVRWREGHLSRLTSDGGRGRETRGQADVINHKSTHTKRKQKWRQKRKIIIIIIIIKRKRQEWLFLCSRRGGEEHTQLHLGEVKLDTASNNKKRGAWMCKVTSRNNRHTEIWHSNLILLSLQALTKVSFVFGHASRTILPLSRLNFMYLFCSPPLPSNFTRVDAGC